MGNQQNLPSELERHGLVTSKSEKIFSIVDAYTKGMGVSMIAMNVLWLLITPASMIGLGITLGVVGGIIATGGVGVLVGLVAIPMAYYAYKEAEKAATLEANIKQQEEIRAEERKKLFYELLRLKILYEKKKRLVGEKQDQLLVNEQQQWLWSSLSDMEKGSFFADSEQGFLAEEKKQLGDLIKQVGVSANEKLYQLVNECYNKLENERDYGCPTPDIISSAQEETEKEQNRKLVFEFLQKDDELSMCFQPIAKEALAVSKTQAVIDGVIGGIASAGVALGSSWAIAAVLVGFGFASAAAIPVLGWVILGLACVALVGFGAGIAYTRYQNTKRKALQGALQSQNMSLQKAQTTCTKAISGLQQDTLRLAKKPVMKQSTAAVLQHEQRDHAGDLPTAVAQEKKQKPFTQRHEDLRRRLFGQPPPMKEEGEGEGEGEGEKKGEGEGPPRPGEH